VEPAFRDINTAVAAIAEGVAPMLGEKPFAIFGHSMGALIAFELTRTLQAKYGLVPTHLLPSGCYAPHLPDPFLMHHLSDKEFLEKLRELNGMPAEVLNTPELLELVFPTIRADFELTETYKYTPGPRLSCPITAFTGTQDPMASDAEVEAWREHTASRFTLHRLPGDHFFVQSCYADVLHLVSKAIS
jgi:medium-chain acyl-[acyl-carrier-protein] hydrolase